MSAAQRLKHIHPDTRVSVRFHFMTRVNGGQVRRTIKKGALPGFLREVKSPKCLFILPSFSPSALQLDIQPAAALLFKSRHKKCYK